MRGFGKFFAHFCLPSVVHVELRDTSPPLDESGLVIRGQATVCMYTYADDAVMGGFRLFVYCCSAALAGGLSVVFVYCQSCTFVIQHRSTYDCCNLVAHLGVPTKLPCVLAPVVTTYLR